MAVKAPHIFPCPNESNENNYVKKSWVSSKLKRLLRNRGYRMFISSWYEIKMSTIRILFEKKNLIHA